MPLILFSILSVWILLWYEFLAAACKGHDDQHAAKRRARDRLGRERRDPPCSVYHLDYCCTENKDAKTRDRVGEMLGHVTVHLSLSVSPLLASSIQFIHS